MDQQDSDWLQIAALNGSLQFAFSVYNAWNVIMLTEVTIESTYSMSE